MLKTPSCTDCSSRNKRTEIYKADPEAHASNLTKKLQTFYDQRELFDVVLVAELDNIEVHAHRVVLSASSGYFLGMFRSNLKESKAEKVPLPAIGSSTLKSILGFMYTAAICISSDSVENILKAADFFQMSTLISLCFDFMTKEMEAYNCLGMAFLAEQLGHMDMYKKALEFASTLFDKVCAEHEFYKLDEEQLIKYLSSDDLRVASEENVFLSLVAWIEHDKENRKKSLFNLLKVVRFTLLKPDFITENIDPLCESEECKQLIKGWLTWHSSSPENLFKPRKTVAHLLVLSGYDSDTFELHTYNRAIDHWSREDYPPPPRKLSGCGAIVIDKKLILAGGELDGHILNTVYSLDLQSMEWTELPPLKDARRNPDLCELNRQLYVVGGFKHAVGAFAHAECSQSVERYDFISSKWESLEALPSTHDGVLLAVLNGKLYANYNKTSFLDCYDPITNEWSERASKKMDLRNIGMAAVKGHLYAVGGEHEDERPSVIESYDPLRNLWTLIGAPEFTRSHTKCVALNNRLIACGGILETGENSNLVEEYDPDLNEWTTLAPMLPHDPCCFVMSI